MLNSKSTKQVLKLSAIRQDEQIQPRQAPNQEVVTEYSFAMKQGDEFPPIIVFYDGSNHWLSDGFHRVKAKEMNGDQNILAEVELGTRREAMLYAVGANSKHGLQRTNADKRKVVMSLISDPEWSKWSDREIARQCGVDHKTVGKYRRALLSNSPLLNLPGEIPQIQNSMNQSQYQAQRKIQRNGKVHCMDVTNIGYKSSTSTDKPKGHKSNNSTSPFVTEDRELTILRQAPMRCEGGTTLTATDMVKRNCELTVSSSPQTANSTQQFCILHADVDPPEVADNHLRLRAQFVIQGPTNALPTIIAQMRKHREFAEKVWLQAQQLLLESAS